jgi:hypothetical protein
MVGQLYETLNGVLCSNLIQVIASQLPELSTELALNEWLECKRNTFAIIGLKKSTTNRLNKQLGGYSKKLPFSVSSLRGGTQRKLGSGFGAGAFTFGILCRNAFSRTSFLLHLVMKPNKIK